MNFFFKFVLCMAYFAVPQVAGGWSRPIQVPATYHWTSRTNIIKVVTFYQYSQCSGRSYGMTLGNGECRPVPEFLSQSGWDLSLDPLGNCVKVFDNPNCHESIAPAGYSLSSTSFQREDIVRRCRSTKELGFQTVRAFRKVEC